MTVYIDDILLHAFVKQLGAVTGRELGAGPKGGDWNAWPADLKVRRFPRTAAVPS
jgi:hypothetical protein